MVAIAIVSASFESTLRTEVTLMRPLARITGAGYLVVSEMFSFSLSTISGSTNWKKNYTKLKIMQNSPKNKSVEV